MPFLNRIRLPFYLSRPQYPAEEEVYLKSNGRRVTLKSVINKLMDGKTDYMPSLLHERLNIALRHDEVNVESNTYTGSVRLNGAYDIDWPEFLDYPFAPASFKAFEEAFVARSNRCDICEEVSFVSLMDDDLGILQEGETYQFNVTENDGICCGSPVLSILSYNDTYIDSISIAQDGVVTFTMKTGLDSTGLADLFTYKVVCGELEETAVARGAIEGSGTPLCEAPSNLLLSTVDDDEIHAEWDAPTGGAPADGYHWLLVRIEGIHSFIVSSGDTTATNININSLDCGHVYKFYVRAVCNNATDDFSAYINKSITTPACDTPNEQMTIDLYFDAVFNGTEFEWRIGANIISPLGVTLDEDIEISGTATISGAFPPATGGWVINLLAGNTNGVSGIFTTTPDTGTGSIPFKVVVPSSATGSDLNEYDLNLTV